MLVSKRDVSVRGGAEGGGNGMAGSFSEVAFSDLDVHDAFFDSLKADYRGFEGWFARKAAGGETALVVTSDAGIDALLYLKDEAAEAVPLNGGELPSEPRLKIGTLKIADHVQGTRLGEGAVGLALWHWRDRGPAQVYITVYPRHTSLIGILEKFGFALAGTRPDGELAMVKDRRNLDHTDPYACFPYLTSEFTECNVLPINDYWHDKLFPYSELAGVPDDGLNIAAGNGVSKIYLASPYSRMAAEVGNPILIYRIFTGDGQKTYKSAVTSYGLVTGMTEYKHDGRKLRSLDDLNSQVRNKSVFTADEIEHWYRQQANLVVIEVLYLGYFGPGNNVNHRTLSDAGLFGQHPYNIRYTPDQFRQILELGRFDVGRAIVD